MALAVALDLGACSDPTPAQADATVTDVSVPEHDGGSPQGAVDGPREAGARDDAEERCTRDEDCASGPFCAGTRSCGPGGRCAYILTRLRCQDGQRCTDDLCDEVARACRFVPHPERCETGTVCVPYRGCVAPDAGM